MNVITIILGGGKGTRLYPLTKDRAKPAVPFGAKYRLVDIPISNSINAGFRQIYVLTQFNSASLHLHLSNTYIFDTFSKGFVEILAAEQNFADTGWYEGTADAVRKNLHHFRDQRADYFIILSGDQLYRMDLQDFLQEHIRSGSLASIATTLVRREEASGLGILDIDTKKNITNFIEKPAADTDITSMRLPTEFKSSEHGDKEYLASMGIYIFSAEALYEALDNELTDFGHEIIPQIIKSEKVSAYLYNGYWEDIGTIRSFYESNLNLASINPNFNFYDEARPIYTHRRDLPASKFNYSSMSQTLAADGCVITNANLSNSIVGPRTFIESGANLDGVVCMGADFYETSETREQNRQRGIPDIGIAGGSVIKHAIIDRNARIGSNCRIGVDYMERSEGEHSVGSGPAAGSYWICDGIIVVPKNGKIPNGSVI